MKTVRSPIDRPSDPPAVPDGARLAGSPWFAAALILIGGLVVYSNSFQGRYQFDDFVSIVSNPNIRHLTPIGRVIEAPRDQPIAGRPVVAISLALNYAISGLGVWSYHALNLAVHLLTGLALLALSRKTLRLPRFSPTIRSMAGPLALAVAFLWTIHPLQTESVTYICERAESMAGLLYLATLLAALCGIDAGTGRRRAIWFTLALAACAIGMLTKETMATVPVMLLLYDRIFIGESFREIFRRRWGLYAALAGTWAILGVLMAEAPRGGTTGFALPDLTPLQQIATQPGVILHYLRLVLWPDPLVLDYGWPVARDAAKIAATSIAVLLLLAGTIRALLRRSPAGFLGAWFFGILAPTSSFIPVLPACFEHRMYLPLAAVLALAVVGGFAVAERALARRGGDAVRRRRTGRLLAISLLAPIIIFLGMRTLLRNRDYADEVRFCRKDTIARPLNAHAHRNLGLALVHDGRFEEAIPSFQRAIELQPQNPTAHCNLAGALSACGRTDEAEVHYTEAIRQQPAYPEARYNLGRIEADRGRPAEAERNLRDAIRYDPRFVEARWLLGRLLAEAGRESEAIEQYRAILDTQRDHAGALNALAWLLATSASPSIRNGAESLDLARQACAATRQADPYSLDTLAAAYAETGQFPQAIATMKRAITLLESDPRARAVESAFRSRLETYERGLPFRN